METSVSEISINGIAYVPRSSVPAVPTPVGDAVIVRADFGVFFGHLVKKDGNSVELQNARQIWSWDSKGLEIPANTCGDIALRGVGTGSKVSDASPRVIVERVGAIFFCTAIAVSRIEAQKWK